MKRYGVLLVFLMAGVPGAFAQDEANEVSRSEEEVTIVTSDRLTYDATGQFALFEENVVVTDPKLQLTSDELRLLFNKEGEAESIEAKGNVNISQGDKKSTSDLAIYNVTSGKIVLTGNPRVRRGKDELQGDTITFWRDKNKLICEPKARLVIYPEKGGGTKNQLFGEE